MRSSLLLPILVAALAAPSFTLAMGSPAPQRSTASRSAPAAHFSEVSKGIYRGARPKAEDLAELSKMGVRTVINLQGGDLKNARFRAIMPIWEPGELPKNIERERVLAEKLGIAFVHQPLDSLDPVTEEEDRQIDEILSVMSDTSAQPVFIHCEHGKDRTGLVIALYRIRYEGWSVEDARKEWYAKGHSSVSRVFTGNLDDYFDRKAAELAAENAGR